MLQIVCDLALSHRSFSPGTLLVPALNRTDFHRGMKIFLSFGVRNIPNIWTTDAAKQAEALNVDKRAEVHKSIWVSILLEL